MLPPPADTGLAIQADYDFAVYQSLDTPASRPATAPVNGRGQVSESGSGAKFRVVASHCRGTDSSGGQGLDQGLYAGVAAYVAACARHASLEAEGGAQALKGELKPALIVQFADAPDPATRLSPAVKRAEILEHATASQNATREVESDLLMGAGALLLLGGLYCGLGVILPNGGPRKLV